MRTYNFTRSADSRRIALISGFAMLTMMALCIPGQLIAQQEALNPSGFVIKRGTNLSHWLSQDFGWAPKYTYINENDLKYIKSVGFDHVRIPIDEMEMWDKSGRPIPEAFQWLHRCLEWSAKYDLRAIVDLHILRAHHFNAENEGGKITLWTDPAAQANLVGLWEKLSREL
jgi:endoglucanase